MKPRTGRASGPSTRARIKEVLTASDGTWRVHVAEATNGLWYVIDQGQPSDSFLRYVGPFKSREDALEVAYDRFACPTEHATISHMASPKTRQRTPSRQHMPEVLVKLGIPQEEFEDMLDAIDREGYFEIGPDEPGGIQTIDRSYSLSELGLEGLDRDQGG